MIRPDFRDFRTRSKSFQHSSEGSSWKKHKYIKRVDGTYYYPDSYEGGRHLPKGSKFGEYTKGDPDFDDKNFDEKNRLGDTDFFGFKREDGTYVILEEDMKWELPAGTKITPELIDRLEEFGQKISEMREKGERFTNEDWTKWAKDAIDGDEDSSDGAKNLTKNDVEKLAKEVIRGNFGNGQERKDLLGGNYEEIQKRVNELMKGSAGSKTIPSDKTKAISVAEEAAKKAVALVNADRNKKTK